MFDIALFVIKSTDYRFDIEEKCAIFEMLNHFMMGVFPQRIYLVITHCDVKTPTEDQILERLQCYKECTGLEIPRSNVILFGNNKESLRPLF